MTEIIEIAAGVLLAWTVISCPIGDIFNLLTQCPEGYVEGYDGAGRRYRIKVAPFEFKITEAFRPQPPLSNSDHIGPLPTHFIFRKPSASQRQPQ